MPWYELAKVVHFLGLIALFGFFVIYSRAGPRLRKAKDLAEVRVWLGLLDLAKPMMPGAGVMLIASGVTMGMLRWKGPYPFMMVGLITIAIIWTLAARIGGRHLGAMHAAAVAESGPVPPELSRIILDPKPWATLFALNTAALGVLIVMTTKLGWVGAVSVVLGLAILGALIGSRMVAGERTAQPGT
ncbi:MAG TPA: hypothetical protein VJV79_05600 [Polyangiaceae bacterium]|nr:hypothetical protein [Polyangiaceae bacterium]